MTGGRATGHSRQNWTAAVAKALARPSKKPPAKGAELIARRTKHGTQLVRAAEGRWNQATEEDFLAALARTGCVLAAADAIGFSTNALYMRRENYPDFAERWERAKALSRERVPDLLHAASIAALDPEVEGRDLPPVNVDQAIRISKMNRPPPGRRGGIRPRIATNAEVEEALRKALKAFRTRVRACQLDEGWSRTASGQLIPAGLGLSRSGR